MSSSGTTTTSTTAAGTTTTTTTGAASAFTTFGTGKSLSLAGNVNLVVDGNSIMTSAYSSVGAFDASLRLYAPLSTGVDTSISTAISGQTWEDMTADHADTDAAWVEGATNILFLGETRNQVVLDYDAGTTTTAGLVALCKTAITNYLAAVRAVRPGWKVIIGGTLPSGKDSAFTRFAIENAAFSEVDQWLRDNVDAFDLYAFVGYRNHVQFNHDGTATAPFAAYPTFWQENSGSSRYTHPRDPGKALMSQNVNSAVAVLAGL